MATNHTSICQLHYTLTNDHKYPTGYNRDMVNISNTYTKTCETSNGMAIKRHINTNKISHSL